MKCMIGFMILGLYNSLLYIMMYKFLFILLMLCSEMFSNFIALETAAYKLLPENNAF